MKNNSIVLSIRPNYVKLIFEGSKKYELRRKLPKNLEIGSLVLVYATTPLKCLYGAFIVDDLIEISINELWKKVKTKAGIDELKFFDYFKNCDYGCAIKIGRKWKLDCPINLESIKEKDVKFNVPQSFRYLTNKDITILQENNTLSL